MKKISIKKIAEFPGLSLFIDDIEQIIAKIRELDPNQQWQMCIGNYSTSEMEELKDFRIKLKTVKANSFQLTFDGPYDFRCEITSKSFGNEILVISLLERDERAREIFEDIEFLLKDRRGWRQRVLSLMGWPRKVFGFLFLLLSFFALVSLPAVKPEMFTGALASLAIYLGLIIIQQFLSKSHLYLKPRSEYLSWTSVLGFNRVPEKIIWAGFTLLAGFLVGRYWSQLKEILVYLERLMFW